MARNSNKLLAEMMEQKMKLTAQLDAVTKNKKHPVVGDKRSRTQVLRDSIMKTYEEAQMERALDVRDFDSQRGQRVIMKQSLKQTNYLQPGDLHFYE